MTNQDFLIMNPKTDDDQANRPVFATTLEEHNIDYRYPFLNED